jgi:renalase
MRVVVVGAGLSGLVAARALRDDGHDVVVVDKGRSPGGRLATRRITAPDGGVARLDHGAQFFTVRSREMQDLVDDWTSTGLVREWCRGFTRGSLDTSVDGHDGHPRYVVRSGMTSLAKHLADGLDVRCGVLVSSIAESAAGWRVTHDGGDLSADAVVVTSPLPQTVALLDGIELPDALRHLDYDRAIALLAVLDRPGGVPSPGGVQDAGEVLSWVGDNAAKGVSDVPALTLHASPAWSETHWDASPDEHEQRLRDAAAPWLGDAVIVAAEVKRWRYATPRTTWPEPCWATTSADGGVLVLAGDAFAGPRVEGAVLSGAAAAARLATP